MQDMTQGEFFVNYSFLEFKVFLLVDWFLNKTKKTNLPSNYTSLERDQISMARTAWSLSHRGETNLREENFEFKIWVM